MKRTFLAAILSLLLAVPSSAAPDVQYSVSGSPGNWTLDFAVTNTLAPPGMDIYFFGVTLPARDILSSPPDWEPVVWFTWDNLVYGGSPQIYNNNWIDLANFAPGEILVGETQSGFKAHVSTAAAPNSVQWFAFAYGAENEQYPGNDHFNQRFNPGFEGVAFKVPEPGTMPALVIACAILTSFRRRFCGR